MDKKAIINLYKDYARVEFKFRTSDELKADLKTLDWAHWFKKDDGGKVNWFLSLELKEDKTIRLQKTFFGILKNHDVEPVIRPNGIVGADETAEKAEPISIQMKPSMRNRLQTVADKKGMSLSEFLIVCADYYLQTNVVDESMSDDLSTSDRIRAAIAIAHTKPALVADSLGMKRSQFYSKLESDRWTEQEKKELSVLLKTVID